MKAIVCALAALTLVELIVGEHIIGTINSNGEYVTEDIDAPVPVPRAVDVKKLNMMLYTRNNKDTPDSLITDDASTLKSSHFDASRKTKFIVHGWESSYKADPVQNLKNTFLSKSDCNVILLDWESYNSPYLSSYSNAKGIAKCFAAFINFLMKNNLKPEDIHIIGHSLGAHIAGCTGKLTDKKCARITGLDPAGPMFADSKPEGRLDKDDAVFVDAIHTSTMAGINTPIAQADFFPNGGSGQPGCSNGGCDHTIVYEYYSNSINAPSKYQAWKCSSESEAKAKSSACAASNARMGEDAINTASSGIYYVPVE